MSLHISKRTLEGKQTTKHWWDWMKAAAAAAGRLRWILICSVCLADNPLWIAKRVATGSLKPCMFTSKLSGKYTALSMKECLNENVLVSFHKVILFIYFLYLMNRHEEFPPIFFKICKRLYNNYSYQLRNCVSISHNDAVLTPVYSFLINHNPARSL